MKIKQKWQTKFSTFPTTLINMRPDWLLKGQLDLGSGPIHLFRLSLNSVLNPYLRFSSIHLWKTYYAFSTNSLDVKLTLVQD